MRKQPRCFLELFEADDERDSKTPVRRLVWQCPSLPTREKEGEQSLVASEKCCFYKKPVDFSKLVATAAKFANEKYVPLCSGITGTVGALVVDLVHKKTTAGMPIDWFVFDLTKEEMEDDDNDK